MLTWQGAALDLIEGEEDIRLRIVTTDTNRLSCSEAKFNIESDKIALFKNLLPANDQNHLKKIIPKKGVMQLRRLCDVAEEQWTLCHSILKIEKSHFKMVKCR